MRRLSIAVLMCALGLTGISAPASASQVERPFAATFSGATTDIVYAPGFDFGPNWMVTSTFDGRCPAGASWLISFAGSGYGTHLGEFTWTSQHCTLVTSLTPPNIVSYGGRAEYVTSNGDVLDENYQSTGGLTLEGDQLCGNYAATFDGGSGRFEQASGTAVEHGCWPASIQGPVIHDLVIKSVGRIAYDATDRR